MTTNSPNPVDGDVQALIADCQNEIAELEKRLTTWGEAWIPYLQSKLKRQQIALAALTAVPEYNTSDEYGEIYLDVSKDRYDECHEDYRWISYPAPPAQLLRPVELPEAKDKRQGWKIDPDYLSRIAEYIGESEEHGTPPCLEHVEAVLLAFNEVKS